MHMVWTDFCLYYMYLFPFAQHTQNIRNVLFQLPKDNLSPKFGCKHYMIPLQFHVVCDKLFLSIWTTSSTVIKRLANLIFIIVGEFFLHNAKAISTTRIAGGLFVHQSYISLFEKFRNAEQGFALTSKRVKENP